jgi:hypothetical protein
MLKKFIYLCCAILGVVLGSEAYAESSSRPWNWTGTWDWNAAPSTATFSISITQHDGKLTGQYCAVALNGNKIDCSDKLDAPNIKFISNKNGRVVVEFSSFFDAKNGLAELNMKDGHLIWHVIKDPMGGEFFAPHDAVLDRPPVDTKALAEGLCKSNEYVFFNCELSKSIASLCQSDDGATIYRHGRGGKVDMQVSDDNEKGRGHVFFFSSTGYAGGGEAHIRFSQSRYTYYLYDKTIKTEDGPYFSSGIVILKDDKKITNLVCDNDASVRARAYQSMTEEAYRDIDSK